MALYVYTTISIFYSLSVFVSPELGINRFYSLFVLTGGRIDDTPSLVMAAMTFQLIAFIDFCAEKVRLKAVTAVVYNWNSSKKLLIT